MSGNNYNDIVTVSPLARFAHFNGEDWVYNDDVYDMIMSLDGIYNLYCNGVIQKENNIVIYGSLNSGSQAWIAIGTRD